MSSTPRNCNYCGVRHELSRMETIALMTSPAIVAMAFRCTCDRIDLVLLPISAIMEHYPDILDIDLGMTDDAKRRFVKELEDYGNG